MRIRLNDTNWKKLKKLIRERDDELKDIYEEILGIPFPQGETEVHHVLPREKGETMFQKTLSPLTPGFIEADSISPWATPTRDGRQSPESISKVRR